MTFAEEPVASFHALLASDAPTPGGGSAAAIAGASAAALVEMVCRLTLNDDDRAGVHDEMATRADDLAGLRTALQGLADEDAGAFDGVMDAFRRPGDDPDRPAAIQTAMTTAAEVPLETAERCLLVIEHAGYVAAEGTQSAVTDAGAGALLAHAALLAALYNVEINLGSIDDAETVEALDARCEALTATAEAARRRVEAIVTDAI